MAGAAAGLPAQALLARAELAAPARAPPEARAVAGALRSAPTFPPECYTTPCTLDVAGTPRTYYVQLPVNYSSSRPYPLVFQFHPLGGSASQARTMYNIRSGMPDAIYVSPQGLGASAGWANTGGQDIQFTKAMIATVEASYCVDKARIFSTGFSYGGSFSLAVGCQMSDVFRAIGVQAGLNFESCRPTHPVAVWQTNGSQDTVADPPGAMEARDVFVAANHCKSTTQPVAPSPCVSYDGCDAGYPVVWCLHSGGHSIPSFSSSAITAFFKQF